MGKYTQIVCAKRYTDSNQKKPGIDILIADKIEKKYYQMEFIVC